MELTYEEKEELKTKVVVKSLDITRECRHFHNKLINNLNGASIKKEAKK